MYTFEDLKQIMKTLRAEDGCPWDRAQDHETLKKHLVEECAEVLEAIDAHDTENLCEELGDVLFQVMFHSEIEAEQGNFTVDDVVNGICEKMIRRHTPDFSIEKVDMNDPATYEMLGKGSTMGVFQLESAGITNVVTGLRPQSIEDITAVVALYRPGPMQSIPRYIECRHHPEKVTYKHPLLEPILGVTYGCMIYQEQVPVARRLLARQGGHGAPRDE